MSFQQAQPPKSDERRKRDDDNDASTTKDDAALLPPRLSLTFSWLTPFVWKSSRGTVGPGDIRPVDAELRSEGLGVGEGMEGDLLRWILREHGRTLALSGLLQVLAGASLQATPFVLGWLLEVMEGREAGLNPSDRLGYLGAAGLAGLLLVKALLGNQGAFLAYRMGLKVRTALSTSMHAHLLTMSNGAKQVYPVGRTVKLLSADVLKIMNVLEYVHYLWLGPFQLIFTFTMVYLAIGWPALLSLSILLLAVPVQIQLTRLLIRNRERVSTATEKRLRVLQEMVLGIRVIKLYGWEDLFLRRLEECRGIELGLVRRQNLIYGCSIVMSVVVPAFATVAAFVAYALAGNSLVASVVSQVCLYLAMLDAPLFNLPLVINTGIDLQASLRRLQSFLTSERLDQIRPAVVVDRATGLTIRHGDFDWEAPTAESKAAAHLCRTIQQRPGDMAVEKSDMAVEKSAALSNQVSDDQPHQSAALSTTVPARMLNVTPHTAYDREEHVWVDPADQMVEGRGALRGINLSIPPGSLVAIVGPVGSGKSSLLQAILGEMRSSPAAEISVGGRVAYVPQEAWIMNGTIRENILFGRAYEQERYERVLRECTIDTDLAGMPAGDQTVVGEKGVALSGGQKARLCLARGVYGDEDVWLLDDPLSAVDARVARHLFHRCISEGLLHGKTRLLVTHQLAMVPHCHLILVLKHGRISEIGSYDQLMSAGGTFADMMGRLMADREVREDAEGLSSDDEEQVILQEHIDVGDDDMGDDEDDGGGVVDRKKTEGVDETPKPSYGAYIAMAGGPAIAITALLAVAANEFFRAGNDLWLTVWMLRSPWPHLSQPAYIAIYILFACGLTVCTWTCVLVFTLGGVRAAKRMHARSVDRLFRAPMSFFEATPLGRILNRFSRDQEVVDSQVADSIYFWLYLLAILASTLLFFSLAASWKMALTLSAALSASFYLQHLYAQASWKLARLYTKALSPAMRHLTETFAGLTVIRVHGMQAMMTERYHRLTDAVTAATYTGVVLKRWTSVRVELLGSILLLLVATLAWALHLPSQLAGKIIEFTLLLITSMDYFVRQYAEMEGNMVAVDRLTAYASETAFPAEDLDLVRKPSSTGTELTESWPPLGKIEFRQLSVAYQPHLPPVLHSLSLAIPPGHKVAIVGRTGAGKSTILSAIFRLVEPVAGTILIDGLDIQSLSLRQLRSRITIVPQDPVLFSGSIRFNLDPTASHPDAAIWDALDAVHAKDLISAMPGKLDAPVLDFGDNFSTGQRQLLCLARAILHKSKVILMDEPTASMDLDTDRIVQEAIRRCFADSTVINISHRLGMIREYDRVMVLDAGRIIEYDSPDALLARPSSILAQLYAEYSQ